MATNDPITAAEQLAGSTYASAQQRTAAGKKALLDQLSSAGTYQNQIDTSAVQAASAPAQPTHLGTPGLNQAAGQGATQVSQFGQAALAAATALAAQARQAQQQAAGTYFDQVAAALPIEQSRAQSEAGQIMARIIQEREERANRLAEQQLRLQETRERISAARAAREAQASGLMDPSERIAVNSAIREQALSGLLNYNRTTQQFEDTRQSRAAELILSGVPADEAFEQTGLRSTRFKDNVINAVNNYHRLAEEYGYYAGTGRSRPGDASYTPNPTGQQLYDMLRGIMAPETQNVV